jgi:hypothetical protein
MDSQHRSHSTRRRSAPSSQSRSNRGKSRHELIDPLTGVALRRKCIYATAVTAALAIRVQNSEQDSDVADCLRTGVCDPLGSQLAQLKAIIEKLGGPLPAALRGEP